MTWAQGGTFATRIKQGNICTNVLHRCSIGVCFLSLWPKILCINPLWHQDPWQTMKYNWHVRIPPFAIFQPKEMSSENWEAVAGGWNHLSPLKKWGLRPNGSCYSPNIGYAVTSGKPKLLASSKSERCLPELRSFVIIYLRKLCNRYLAYLCVLHHGDRRFFR